MKFFKNVFKQTNLSTNTVCQYAHNLVIRYKFQNLCWNDNFVIICNLIVKLDWKFVAPIGLQELYVSMKTGAL